MVPVKRPSAAVPEDSSDVESEGSSLAQTYSVITQPQNIESSF